MKDNNPEFRSGHQQRPLGWAVGDIIYTKLKARVWRQETTLICSRGKNSGLSSRPARRGYAGNSSIPLVDSQRSRVLGTETLPTNVHLVEAMVFLVVMYECESWTIKKAEHQRIDAFELWCWRRLLRVPWTARRSNQSIIKEISLGRSLEGLMLKLKL